MDMLQESCGVSRGKRIKRVSARYEALNICGMHVTDIQGPIS